MTTAATLDRPILNGPYDPPELKKTGAGNLFTVFGEPDIDVRVEGDEVRVDLRGTDEVASK